MPAGPESRSESRSRLLTPYGLGVGAVTTALGAFLLARLTAWPPNEDETLVYFIARKPLGDVLHTVTGERGGAPLHFLLAHFALDVSPTLASLRLLSAVPVVLAFPVMAALIRRLAGSQAALVGLVLLAASWTTLFHAIYARMYGLFLLTSALAFLTLLRALERPGWRRWGLWSLAMLATIATHPYGVLVLAACVAHVAGVGWRRPRRLVRPAAAVAAVAVAAVPLWLTYAHLADRFDVEAGAGAAAHGSPSDVFLYLWRTFGNFTAGWAGADVALALTALAGLVLLVRMRREAAILTGAAVLVPTAALLVTRSGSILFLEPRHLIFVLPFVAAALATAILAGARTSGARGPAIVALSVAVLVSLELSWGFAKTPWLFTGEPAARTAARDAAAGWLARTGRPDDVLLGYEPLYLDAEQAGAPYGGLLVPRADPALALAALGEAPRLGRGVWVLDASDELDPSRVRLELPARTPGPGFEARSFGPFLVVRSTEPTRTPRRFLEETIRVESMSRTLAIGDAWLNLKTAEAALAAAG